VDLVCRQGRESIGLKAVLCYQKPRSFRLLGRVVGEKAVDIGSNEEEYWLWCRKAEPVPFLYFKHKDTDRPTSGWGNQFEPDCFFRALGVREYVGEGAYEVRSRPDTIELVETVPLARGKPARYVTIFNRSPSPVQVAGYRLETAQKKVICSISILETQCDPGSGAVVPRQLQLAFPTERIEIRVRLDEVKINEAIATERASRLFRRPELNK
jgi:hypothetical protein